MNKKRNSVKTDKSVNRKDVNIPQRSDYLKLIELHNTNRIDYNNRKWETVKFFQSIYSALITASVAAILGAKKFQLYDDFVVKFAIAMIIIISLISIIIGRNNLRRESKLLFMEEYQTFKITRFLNMDHILSENNKWLPGDNNLLLPKWRDYKYGTKCLPDNPSLEQWLKSRVGGHLFGSLFERFFMLEAIAAFLLGVSIFMV